MMNENQLILMQRKAVLHQHESLYSSKMFIELEYSNRY